RRLADAGYATFGFDYRGFGRSEGRDKLVHPLMQSRDVRNALTYLQSRPEIDPDRIGLWGRSLGAAVAVYTAALDPRPAATVSMSGIGNCRRWLKQLIPHGDWLDLMAELDQDRRARVLSGKGKSVPAYFIVRKRQQEFLEETAKHEASGSIGGEI